MTLQEERKLKLMEALEMVEEAVEWLDEDQIDGILLDMPRLSRMLEEKFRRTEPVADLLVDG